MNITLTQDTVFCTSLISSIAIFFIDILNFDVFGKVMPRTSNILCTIAQMLLTSYVLALGIKCSIQGIVSCTCYCFVFLSVIWFCVFMVRESRNEF